MGTDRKLYAIGIRGKLVLSLLLLVVLSMWLLGLALMDLMRSAAREQLRARGKTIAAAVEHAAALPPAVPAGGAGVPERLPPLLAALTVDPDVAVHITPRQARDWLNIRRKTDLLQDVDPEDLSTDLGRQYEADIQLRTAVLMLKLMDLHENGSVQTARGTQ